MKLLKSITLTLITSATCFSLQAGTLPENLKTIDEVKSQILDIANQYKGMADPEFAIQNELMPYVNRLLELSPQAPVAERISTLAGPWKQVWGPYEYRKNDRSVDPTIDIDNIYQVIFEDGYYYNVGNQLDKKTGQVKKVTLLRGEFEVASGNDLNVKFTKLNNVKRIPEGLTYVDLPALSENKILEGEKVSLWSWIVKLTFPGGTLSEIYTDSNLRLVIGNSVDSDGVQGYLYVMVRASN